MHSSFRYILYTVLLISILIKPGYTNNKKENCTNYHYAETNKNIEVIDIQINNQKKWYRNVLAIYSSLSKNKTIDESFKKRFKSKIIVKYSDGSSCLYIAKIKSTGLSNFHFSKKKFTTSLDVKLLEGHIFNITNFRLLLPKSRAGDNEIFLTTLLENFNFVVPHTRYVDVVINEKKQKFIFQEKFTKELLERNYLREGPVYLMSNLHSKSEYPSLKVENSGWIKNDYNKFYESSDGMRKINELFELKIGNNFYLNLEAISNSKIISEFKIYNTLLLVASATHGLGIRNQVIYIDPILQELRPIYNDGKSSILLDRNLEDSNFDNIVKMYSTFKINPILSLNKLNQINLNNFKNQIKNKNLSLSSQKIDTAFSILRKRLEYLDELNKLENSIKDNKKKILEIKYLKKLDDKFDYIFFDDSTNKEGEFILCKNLKNCHAVNNINLFSSKKINNDIDFKKALKQDFKNNNYFFLGNYKSIEEKVFLNFFQTYLFNNFKLLSNKGIAIQEVDYKNKIINISQINKMGKAIFTGKTINDWKINFTGLKDLDFKSNNFKNLTGCLTFIDIEIKNITIKTNNGTCEDTVNFVRSRGSLKSYTSLNSLSDSLDSDFSEINFQKLKITNSINDCLDFSFGIYTVLEGEFLDCGDKAISVGEKSSVKIKKIIIKNANIGIASKDGSKTFVDLAKISNTKLCLSAYKKKQEFSGGFIQINDLECKDYTNIVNTDVYSKINIKKMSSIK
jgi:hypothetical protein